ncbi:MAG: hypothetical protein KDI71_20070, partial [Xanthomonadales bacterium]|nr:hypothetical protein [Xanthomonadales bacterium]
GQAGRTQQADKLVATNQDLDRWRVLDDIGADSRIIRQRARAGGQEVQVARVLTIGLVTSEESKPCLK